MAHRIVPGVVKGFEAKVHEQGKVEASKADGMEGSSAFLLGAALGGVCPLGVEPMVHVLARLEHRDQLLGHRDHLSIARVSSVSRIVLTIFSTSRWYRCGFCSAILSISSDLSIAGSGRAILACSYQDAPGYAVSRRVLNSIGPKKKRPGGRWLKRWPASGG